MRLPLASLVLAIGKCGVWRVACPRVSVCPGSKGRLFPALRGTVTSVRQKRRKREWTWALGHLFSRLGEGRRHLAAPPHCASSRLPRIPTCVK